jgi:hypothetical protein
MAEDSQAPRRWTAKRRVALRILKGETSVQAAVRKHGLTVAEMAAPVKKLLKNRPLRGASRHKGGPWRRRSSFQRGTASR